MTERPSHPTLRPNATTTRRTLLCHRKSETSKLGCPGRGARLVRRPRSAVLLALALLIAVAPAATLAQDALRDGGASPLLPDPQAMRRVEASVDRAVNYLISQQRENGAWPSGHGDNHGVNGLCLLALLGRGHVPGRGPHRDAVNLAVEHLLATQHKSGLYKSPNNSHGPMYEHALATLAMIEAYGYLPARPVRRSVQRAINLIVDSQNSQGGWRYHPGRDDADLSVTVMQVVALRAAQNARLRVPQKTLDQALKYVRSCAVDKGGFAYQPRQNNAAMARTAAGTLSMQLLGAFDDETVDKGVAYMADRRYRKNHSHFWYMSYYAMQAHFQAGGTAWAQWHPTVRRFLLDHQEPDGSWPGYSGKKHNGRAHCYSTALAAMTLEVYMHYLPAYQR